MKPKDFTPHAALCLSNWGGIEIMLDDNCESVYYRYYDKLGQRPCRIDYDKDGEPFFRCKYGKFNIGEFMRI